MDSVANVLQSIRSFDNQKAETIEFYTPLTLIVGYNGSGKTVSAPTTTMFKTPKVAANLGKDNY